MARNKQEGQGYQYQPLGSDHSFQGPALQRIPAAFTTENLSSPCGCSALHSFHYWGAHHGPQQTAPQRILTDLLLRKPTASTAAADPPAAPTAEGLTGFCIRRLQLPEFLSAPYQSHLSQCCHDSPGLRPHTATPPTARPSFCSCMCAQCHPRTTHLLQCPEPALSPVTGLHCHVCPQLNPEATRPHATNPKFCHWPPLPCMHLQLAGAASRCGHMSTQRQPGPPLH